MLSRIQTKIVHVVATSLFAALLSTGCFLLYYTWIALSGDPGGPLIDGITWALDKQQSALAILGTVATAVPAFALALANTAKGGITRRGWVYLTLLIPTFLLAAFANFVLEPESVNLGTATTPVVADGTALRVAGFALTYITAIFGLNRMGGRTDSVSATASAPPKAKRARRRAVAAPASAASGPAPVLQDGGGQP